jgi:uncharacterized protein YcbX
MSERLLDVVTGVNIYPIKSCQSATIDEEVPSILAVGRTGFEAYGVSDREFVIVEETDEGADYMVSQRGWKPGTRKQENAGDKALATVEVDISHESLTVISKGFGGIEIETTERGGQAHPVNIHGKELQAIDQGKAAGRYFSELLGRGVRLVRASREHVRQLPEPYKHALAANELAGADGFPYLLTSQASLDWLHKNQMLRRDEKALPLGSVPMNRYRPNIVIAGKDIGPFGEDYIRQLQIHHVGAYIMKACSRCPIPDNDQSTGEKDGLSTRLLRSRVGETADEKGTFFGQNVVLDRSQGKRLTIAVDDTVRVVVDSDVPNVVIR